MKKTLKCIREALGAVAGVMLEFVAEWTGNTAMGAAVDAFNGSLEAVDNKVAIQAVNIKALTKNNNLNKERMANKGLEVANTLCAYFSSVGNLLKMGEMKFSFSNLFYVNGYMAKQLAELIYATADELPVEAKADFQLDISLPQFRAAIDAYDFNAVRNAIVERKSATALIKVLLKDSVDILDERLGNLMNFYRESNPDFWLQFESAKHVVHSTRHTTIEGTVTDLDSGADLKAVKVTITAPGKNFEDMTDVQGKFKQQELNPELDYTLTFELPDYEPYTTTVEDLKPGEHERLSVKLKKIV